MFRKPGPLCKRCLFPMVRLMDRHVVECPLCRRGVTGMWLASHPRRARWAWLIGL